MSRISYFLTAVLYAGGRRWRMSPAPAAANLRLACGFLFGVVFEAWL